MVDSVFPELHSLLSLVRNSRESWFAERLTLEAIARDLLFDLEHYGEGFEMEDDSFEKNMEKFTELLDWVYEYHARCTLFVCAQKSLRVHSKQGAASVLLNEVVENLADRQSNLEPLAVKQTLSKLIIADSRH